ncbi:DNA polymerase II [Candidatus Woesearchaeota archaeon]|nr:DNA polymerase II [Candidatus Woesearchaeota archaeon]
MKGFIVYPTYRVDGSKAQVMLFGRLENGESFVTISDFRPYFWVKKTDASKAQDLIKSLDLKNIEVDDSDFHNFNDEPVSRVTLTVPKEVPELKKIFLDNHITCFEADIRFSYRFMIDHKIKACMEIEGKAQKEEGFFVDKVFLNPEIRPTEFWPELNILSLDIETSMDNKKLYALGIYSKNIKKVLLVNDKKYDGADSFATEKEVLEEFKNIVLKEDPDVITGWNVIDFDFKLIRDLFRKYNLPFVLGRSDRECTLRLTDSFFIDSSANFPGRAVIDGIHLMKVSFLRLDDYKLNTAAKTILGEEKLIAGPDRHKVIENIYHEDPQKLVDYNLQDARLAYEIIIKSNTLDLSIRRSILTRMQLDRVNASIASLDSLYLGELLERKLVAPTAFVNERDERIKGGFVMQSKPGIYNGIIVLDFKSLYPSIIRTFNIDPYSFVPQEIYKTLSEKEKEDLIESPNQAHFKNEEGILPVLINRLWEQRDLAKKRKDNLGSQAIKILMNSFFGVLANPTCRFYSIEMANAITHFGQFLIKLSAEKIQEKGYEVIYGDTDSIFVNTADPEKANRIGTELKSHINNFYQNYVKEAFGRTSFLELEFEKSFFKFLMPKVRGSESGAKKRYAGMIKKGEKEKIQIVGLEFVRRDWTDLSKKFQMELLDHIFHDKPVEAYVRNFVAELKNGKMDNLLVYKKAIRKGVSQYVKTTPPHIKAARLLGRELPGIIEYVITINGPEPLEKQTSKLDYAHYIEKQLKPIADSILSFQDQTFDDLISPHKQTDLSKFQ